MACGEKPCEGISVPDHIKGLDLVLDGGNLCKDEKMVASVDYPGTTPEDITSRYEKELGEKGWEVEQPDKNTLYMTRGGETLFGIMGKSSDRRVTFAIVRYCAKDNELCRKTLHELAKAMAR